MTSIPDQLNLLRSAYTLVGVTGHRDLITDPAVQTLMRERVWKKLTELKKMHANLLLLCPMAPGADQLVKEVADTLAIPVVLLLPMELSDYWNVSFSEPVYTATFTNVTAFVKAQPDQVIHFYQNTIKTDALCRFQKACTERKKKKEKQHVAFTFTDKRQLARMTLDWAVAEPVQRLVNLATVLATYADHILALWDGVDRGLSDGGTSHVVHMALSGLDSDGQRLKRTRPGQLHHLITPRRSNPFPLSARHRAVHQPFPALPSLGELTWDVALPFPPKKDKPGLRARFWQWLHRHWTFIFSFWVPIFLVVFTLIFGYQGFLKLQQYEDALKKQPEYWQTRFSDQPNSLRAGLIRFETYRFRRTYKHPKWICDWDPDAFFKAANLNTLNSSVLGTNENVPLMLEAGRRVGLFFLIYAFVLALLLAIGRERQHLIRLWWIRARSQHWIRLLLPKRMHRRRFSLVIGLNDRSFNLITDLRKQRIPVVLLIADADSPYRESCEKLGVIYLTGLPYVTASLRKSHFQEAERVYVMTDSEENNIRTVQEMDQMWKNTTPSASEWYVQLENAMLADLMLQSFRPKDGLKLHVVNLYETIARRQLLTFPIDRFYPKTTRLPVVKVAQVAIFGFGPMGQALTLACLRLGHFAGGQRLRVRVYVANAAQVQRQFEQHYPCLSTLPDTPYHDGLTRIVRDAAFPADGLTFEELPVSAAQLLNPNFSLFGMVNSRTALSVYGCLEEAMQSAALLRTLLPRLQHLRQRNPDAIADVQVFGFYNLPDIDEVNHLMRQMNALVPGLPVSFFGNFLRECTTEAIHNQALNELGQAINWYYNKTGDSQKNWLATSEENRESSRQAGDHLWVKLRYARHRLNTHPADWYKERKIVAVVAKADKAQRPQVTKKRLMISKYQKYRLRPLIRQLSELEHRRWNAEKLLLGYVALQDTDTVYRQKREPGELMKRWKPAKESYKAQRLQIDLIPFDQLDRYYPKEALKDKAQVEHLPDYLNALLKLDKKNRESAD